MTVHGLRNGPLNVLLLLNRIQVLYQVHGVVRIAVAQTVFGQTVYYRLFGHDICQVAMQGLYHARRLFYLVEVHGRGLGGYPV